MAIKIADGWTLIASWPNTGGVSGNTPYNAPQDALAAGKTGIAIVVMGMVTGSGAVSPPVTGTASYGNCTGTLAVMDVTSVGVSQHQYQFIAYIPLVGYNGVSNTLAITSTNNALSQKLGQSDGGAFLMTLYDVDTDLNANPLSTLQFKPIPPQSSNFPVAALRLGFTTNPGDWLFHAGFLGTTGGALTRLLPASGTDSVQQPVGTGSGEHPNGQAQASWFRSETASAVASWAFPAQSGGIGPGYPVCFAGFVLQDPNPPSFNCDCEAVSPYDTLANVRTKMLIRLGYPNQSTNPPPGMATLIDQFLRDAQDEIYQQLQRAALRTERFFKWTMVPGQRYYAFDDEEVSCDMLNPYKVTWVGFEDLNQAWYRMDEGIPPEYYTRANINFGWPTRYELRSCIEIFPAPQAAYTLWIKGDFGVGALVEDTDRFTIDDKAVYLLALGNAKAHYGQQDAQLVLSQAANFSKALVAGAHGTKRYVPNAGTLSPLTPPRFLPLGTDQA